MHHRRLATEGGVTRVPRAAAVVLCVLASGVARAQTAPYVDPPFGTKCVFHHFGEGQAPPLDGCPDDPFCVEYEKRDITVDNGGAIKFLAAEPARFADAVPKCRYWQRDHWRIQVSSGDQPIVGWDGSYWFNKGNGTGAARFRNFTIDGVPADPGPAANLIGLVDADLANTIRQYGESPGGGGGSTFVLGFTDPSCAPGPGTECENDISVSQARATAEAQCHCATADSHASYVRCASNVVSAEVQAGRLPAACARTVMDCEKLSICGRPPGTVTCCKTDARGATGCSIRDAPMCRPPASGSASLGSGPSCCDPCSVEGCS